MDDNRKEFPSPAPEYVPPETEFPLPGEYPPPAAAAETAKKRRTWRPLPYAAAAILFFALMGRDTGQPAAEEPGTFSDIESVAAVITDTVYATPVPAVTAAPIATAAPTASPTAAPTPTPTPAPIPEEPEVDAVLVSFSANVEGRIYFRYAQNVTAATAEIWDVNMTAPERVIEIPAEAVAQGVFELPSIDTTDVFFAHMDYYFANDLEPVLELRLRVDYEVDGEAKTVSLTRRASDEQGWFFSYYDESEPKTDYSFPGQFAFGTYSGPERVEVVYDEPGRVAEGAVSIRAEINGIPVTAADCQFLTWEDEGYLADGSSVTYYQSVVVISKPAALTDAGGTARISVTQRLRGYDADWETVRTIEW